MTDHLPNDLSHLSDAEFHSLCPQGEHAPGPEPLSPAAQAILNAYGRETGDIDCVWHPSELKGLAAALRAAANQVVPKARAVDSDLDYGAWEQQQRTRAEILAIADELENQP
jgi:hypothetical protein